jgi:hypothetical protein
MDNTNFDKVNKKNFKLLLQYLEAQKLKENKHKTDEVIITKSTTPPIIK